MNRARVLLISLLSLALYATPASALTIPFDILLDPEVLHIGPGAGTACATGGCPTFGGEVNSVGQTKVDIFENGAGQPQLLNPLLMIMGIPNSTTGAPPIATVTSYNPYPAAFPGSPMAGSGQLGGSNTYCCTPGGTGWNITTGFAGSFIASSTQPVYQFIGLNQPTTGSENFTNWQNADLAINGINATSFGIFVYSLTTTVKGQGLVDITFGNPIPLGTFVISYGCSNIVLGVCSGGSNIFTTPFTEAGLVAKPAVIPEPATLVLLGAGVAGLGIFGRKKFAS